MSPENLCATVNPFTPQIPYFLEDPRIIAGRLFLFSDQKRAIIRGRRLFQILLKGGRALYILFYYTKQ